MGRVLLSLQHRLNPLHLYCRLMDRGLPKQTAIRVTRFYELTLHRCVLAITRVGIRLCENLDRETA